MKKSPRKSPQGGWPTQRGFEDADEAVTLDSVEPMGSLEIDGDSPEYPAKHLKEILDKRKEHFDEIHHKV